MEFMQSYTFDNGNILSVMANDDREFFFSLIFRDCSVKTVSEDLARSLVLSEENTITANTWRDFIHASGSFCEDV
jgi:hypothetical protein